MAASSSNHLRYDQYQPLNKADHAPIQLCHSPRQTNFIVRITQDKQSAIAPIVIDPVDNTVFGEVKISDEKMVEQLSTVLASVGGKRFILVKEEKEASTLRGFVTAAEHPFKRLHHGSCEKIQKQTSSEAQKKFDAQYETTIGIEEIEKAVTYPDLCQFFNDYANFTTDKMKEYKQGMPARFHHEAITPIMIRNRETKQICGIIRILSSDNNNVGYLSDEVVNDPALFPYLMHQAANEMIKRNPHQKVIIIAAEGRETSYNQVGFKNFSTPMEGYTLMVQLGSPGLLNDMRRIALEGQAAYTRGLTNSSSALHAAAQQSASLTTPTMKLDFSPFSLQQKS